MVDTRFYTCQPTPLSELIAACRDEGIDVPDDKLADALISGAGTVPFLNSNEIGFVSEDKYLEKLSEMQAGVVLVSEQADTADISSEVRLVRVANPYLVFVTLLSKLFPDTTKLQYTAPNNRPSLLGKDPVIADNVRFGDDVSLGDDVVIGANSVIGRGVTIGHGTVIGDNVSVYSSHIGNNVVVHAGSRIGNEGFGFIPTGDDPVKIPQLGRVIVQDGVEIGASCTIDRGTLDDTVIGEASKLDNMVQIAHNVQIGRNCQISAQAGIAGSSQIGDNVLLGGRVGVVNKARMGDNSVAMACALVTKDVPNGAHVAGDPATDIKLWRKQIAAGRKAARKQK